MVTFLKAPWQDFTHATTSLPLVTRGGHCKGGFVFSFRSSAIYAIKWEKVCLRSLINIPGEPPPPREEKERIFKLFSHLFAVADKDRRTMLL